MWKSSWFPPNPREISEQSIFEVQTLLFQICLEEFQTFLILLNKKEVNKW